ncbi:Gfo/Idh/MocA family protein [Kitasatospora sp. NPDC094028]
MTTRVLLVGAGEVGTKHLTALAGLPDTVVTAVVDPRRPAAMPPGADHFTSWRAALDVLVFDLVIVAAPPGIALTAARAAARSGAAVIVEKPATTDPAALAYQAGDERIFVGFQPHFAPGLDALLARLPAVKRAEVLLEVRRDPGYFRGWRRTYATAGGVLHQQAIHGLALALRLMPGPVETVTAEVEHRRHLADTEDRITAELQLAGGRTLTVDARVDHDGAPRHELVLHLADGRALRVRGRNLEAGLGDPTRALNHEELRQRMYTAVLTAATGDAHPCLFPLTALRRPLEVIDRVYRDAHLADRAHAAAI